MTTPINKLSNTNKAILASLVLISITNPWSVGYIGWASEKLIVYFTLYANYGFVVGLVALAGLNVYVMATTNRTKVPKKTYPTNKAGAFLE